MSDATFRLYAAISLDGFIAAADGGIGWLEAYDSPDYGMDAFLVSVDALVMGRTTYDQVRAFPGDWLYAGKRVWVLTSRPLEADAPAGVKAVADADTLVATLRQRGGLVWLVGGGQTIRAFFDRDAIDEVEVFIIPILLGDGIPLMTPGAGRRLSLLDTEPYRTGAVRLLYAVTETP